MARKILLADDSMIAQSMGKRILAEAGYNVVTVSNGAAAMKKIPDERPDIVLLDVYMPGYSGLEVCQKVRSTPETATIPVILTVGKLEPFSPEEGIRAKADGLIVKPFEATDLLSVVGKLAERLPSEAKPPAWPSPEEPPVEATVDELPLPPAAVTSHESLEENSAAVAFADPVRPNAANFSSSRFSLDLGTLEAPSSPLPAVDVFVPSDNPPQTHSLQELVVEPEIPQPPDPAPVDVEPELEISVEPVVPVNGHGRAEANDQPEITISLETPAEAVPSENAPNTADLSLAQDAKVPDPPAPEAVLPQTNSVEPFDITLEPLPDADVEFVVPEPPPASRLDGISSPAPANDSRPQNFAVPSVATETGDHHTATAVLVEMQEFFAADTPHSAPAPAAGNGSGFSVEMVAPEAALSAAAVKSALDIELDEFLKSSSLSQNHAPIEDESSAAAALEPCAATPEDGDPVPNPGNPETDASPEAADDGPNCEFTASDVPASLDGEDGKPTSEPSLEMPVVEEEAAGTPPEAPLALAVASNGEADSASESESIPIPVLEAAPIEEEPAETVMEAPPQETAEDQPAADPTASITPEALNSLTGLLAEQLADRVLQRLKGPLVQEIKRILSGQ